MKKLILMISTIVAAALLWGCAFIEINLPTGPGPLGESVIEGTGDKKILLVDVSGIISNEERSSGFSAREQSIVAQVHESLKKAAADPDVAGVILRINTPGGSASASDLMYHDILSFKKLTNIPVYASIMDMGTSGGMYVASAAGRIFAQPTSVTGSIGVIAVQINLEGLMSKIGVDEKTYKSGAYKDAFAPYRADTPEEQKIMQSIIDDMYNRFVDVVVEGRKGSLSRKEVLALADGRPYTATQAHKAGLIDEIGYLDDAIAAMKKQLSLTEAKVVMYSRPGAYKGSIYSMNNVQGVNIIGLDAGAAAGLAPGVNFMYLWRQP